MKLDVERWREARRYMFIVMGLAALIALALGGFAEVFVGILFGGKYAHAVTALRLVLPAAVFVSGTSLLSQYLATHGLPSSTALAWLAAVMVCLGFGPYLIRNHGANGAAIVLSCACAIAWLALLALSIRASRIPHEIDGGFRNHQMQSSVVVLVKGQISARISDGIARPLRP